jgi:hypothetical protein
LILQIQQNQPISNSQKISFHHNNYTFTPTINYFFQFYPFIICFHPYKIFKLEYLKKRKKRFDNNSLLYCKIASFIHCLHFSHTHTYPDNPQLKLRLNESFCIVYLIHSNLLLLLRIVSQVWPYCWGLLWYFSTCLHHTVIDFRIFQLWVKCHSPFDKKIVAHFTIIYY